MDWQTTPPHRCRDVRFSDARPAIGRNPDVVPRPGVNRSLEHPNGAQRRSRGCGGVQTRGALLTREPPGPGLLRALACRLPPQELTSDVQPDNRGLETFAMARTRYPTLLDVIQAVSEVAASDQEILATVADLINSGQVRLCGDAAGATIDVSATEDTAA